MKEDKMELGEIYSLLLENLEDGLLDHQVYDGSKLNFTQDGFRAATKIFMDVLLDKMFDLQEKEHMPFKQREEMAEKAGNELHKLIKIYTDIDTREFYK